MLTRDQKDALQEIANIGMGQAGASIAKVLGEFIQLSVPRILIFRIWLPIAHAAEVVA